MGKHVEKKKFQPKRLIAAIAALSVALFAPAVSAVPAFAAGYTVTSVSPAFGTTAGGNTVTINGSGFDGGIISVNFGSTAATSKTLVSSTQITAVVPAHLPGTVQVTLTGSQGPTASSAPYYYGNAPAISSLNPASGASAGGTSVVIHGNNFTGATDVSFGGTPATSFVVNSSIQITAVTPAHATGFSDVIVTNPSGTATRTNSYYFLAPPPVVTSVTPSSGSVNGGTSVVLTGSNFTGTSSVSFGGTAATSFTVNSATQITAVVPAHAAGAVDVSATTDSGTGTAANSFTYVNSSPQVSGITPDTGSDYGGDTVVITGSNFTGATDVKFGDRSATSFHVDSDTQITAVTPANDNTNNNVTVITPSGSSPANPAVSYQFILVPKITDVSPNTGARTGGTFVTLTGEDFSNTGEVYVGNVSVPFTIVSDTKITFTTPAGSGSQGITLYDAEGGRTDSPQDFVYAAPVIPNVTNVSPDNGTIEGGTSVTITGSNFTDATDVKFGDAPATNVNVISDTQITVTAPAHISGTIDVTVTNADGVSATGGNDKFTYVYPAPIVSSIAPDNGPEAGGTVVTITGSHFAGTTGVDFGTTPATNVTVISDTKITATAPAGTGTVNITVTTPGGVTTTTSGDKFTYNIPAPVINQVSPNAGSPLGGTVVTITGVNLNYNPVVYFDGVKATDVTVVSGNEITVTSPAGSGIVDVSVDTDRGTVTAPDSFSYLPAPTSTSISPNSGSVDGGNEVVLTGTGFSQDAKVTVGGKNATIISITSTEIHFTVPSGNAGAVDVVESDANGSTTLVDGYTYIANPPAHLASVTGISPAHGPEAGGNSISVYGSGFQDGDIQGVYFGGVESPGGYYVSDNEIVPTVPPGTGTVKVTVVIDGVTYVSPTDYTYDKPVVVPAPTITSFTPHQGPEAGGNWVTIHGTGFLTATKVFFGTVGNGTFSIISDTEIYAYVPAGTGSVVVKVVTADGDAVADDFYTYVPAKTPVVTSLGTVTGSEKGGNTVKIYGHDFTDATNVLFGDKDATSFVVVSDTEIDAVVPSGTGNVFVTVQTPDGDAVSPEPYVYTPADTTPGDGDGGTGGNGGTGGGNTGGNGTGGGTGGGSAPGTGGGTGTGSGSGSGSGSGTGSTGNGSTGNTSTGNSAASPHKLAWTGSEHVGAITFSGLTLILFGLFLARRRKLS